MGPIAPMKTAELVFASFWELRQLLQRRAAALPGAQLAARTDPAGAFVG
jgi:hypothetical protein